MDIDKIRGVSNEGGMVCIKFDAAIANPKLRRLHTELRMPKAEAWRLLRMLVDARDYDEAGPRNG